MEFRELFGAQAPANFRMARERTGAGTGCVDEDAIELAAEGKAIRGIEFDELHAVEIEPLELIAHCSETMRVAIRGDDQSSSAGGADEGRRFPAGSSTKIQDGISRLNAEQQWNCLRCFVLNRDRALAKGFSASGTAASDGKCGVEQLPRLDTQAGPF